MTCYEYLKVNILSGWAINLYESCEAMTKKKISICLSFMSKRMYRRSDDKVGNVKKAVDRTGRGDVRVSLV